MTSTTVTMSKLRKTMVFLASLVEMTLFSAPLLGWPSLLIILKEERIGSHLCATTTQLVKNISQTIKLSTTLCSEQEKSLNLSHNSSVMVTSVYVFLAGWAVDKYGAKAVKIFSSAMLSVSAVFFFFTSAETPQTLSPALIALGIANTGLFMSVMKSTVLYGKWKSPVNSVFMCALSSSAITFVILKTLHENGVSYKILCQILLYSSLASLLSSVLLFPNISSKEENKPPKNGPKSPKKSCTSVVLAHFRGILVHLRSRIFVLTCLFIGMCRLRCFFFVTTLQQFILALPNTDMETVKSYSDYYGLIQLCSLAMCPLVGGLVAMSVRISSRSFNQHKDVTMETDNQSDCTGVERASVVDMVDISRAVEIRSCTIYYASSGFLLILVSLLTVIHNAPLQICSFVLVTLLRCFYTGGFSNLFLVAFPCQHFGKLFGIGGFVISLIQMLQLPLFNLLETYYPMEIMKFNLSFLVVTIPLGVGYPCYLWWYSWYLANKSRNTPHQTCHCDEEIILYERVTVL